MHFQAVPEYRLSFSIYSGRLRWLVGRRFSLFALARFYTGSFASWRLFVAHESLDDISLSIARGD
jgi:hypothetical protein